MLSKIWVTTIIRSVEKILAAKKMLQPTTTLVPNFKGESTIPDLWVYTMVNSSTVLRVSQLQIGHR